MNKLPTTTFLLVLLNASAYLAQAPADDPDQSPSRATSTPMDSWARSEHASMASGLNEVFLAFQKTSNAWEIKPKFDDVQVTQWQALAENKHPQAMCLVGIKQTLDAQNARDPEKRRAGLDQVLAAAKAGDPTAQFYCSRAYAAGFVFELSIAESMKWAKLSVEQNYPHAYYAEGSGRLAEETFLISQNRRDDVPALRKVALEHFQKSAEAGSALGMWSSGITLDALGEKQAAMDYFAKAAELGNSQALFRLGNELLSGTNIPKDSQRGFKLLLQSAEQGSEALGIASLNQSRGISLSTVVSLSRGMRAPLLEGHIFKLFLLTTVPNASTTST